MINPCRHCSAPLADGAKFCTYCGAAVAVSSPSRHCEFCSVGIPEGARFCVSCGHEVGAPLAIQQAVPMAVETASSPGESTALEEEWSEVAPEEGASYPVSHLPPRRLERRAPREGAVSGGFSTGSLVADVGAALALLGCFLPLATGVGENTSLIPSVSNEASEAYIVPISALLVAFMAWAATTGATRSRVLNGGGVIAVSSPWFVLLSLLLLTTARVSQMLGIFSFGTNVGPGMVVLTLGFALSLLGGFLILHDATE